VVLTSEQRAKLETYARGRSAQARVVLRAPIVLPASEGKQDLKIAHLLSIVPRTAARWRRVFCMTVSRGWSTTLRDLAARLPSHRNSCAW
jgi:hypothetical protein